MDNLGEHGIEKEQSLTYSDIAEALAADYICIYYVDMDTGAYRRYSESADFVHLNLPDRGSDFFSDGITAMGDVIHPEDREIFLAAISGENIRNVLSSDRSFSLTYRMLFGGNWIYISVKATRMAAVDNHHIVVGFSNVNAHMQRLEEYEKMRASSIRFDRVAEALAVDYIKIFYVNIETDRYLEYRGGRRQTAEPEAGFFKSGRNGLLADVCDEDRDLVSLDFRKKKVLRVLKEQKTYALICRNVIGGALRYVSIKAAEVEGDRKHIIVGIRNVDDEIRREEDYLGQLRSARALADTDQLTGVKSKHAYARKEAELDRMIAEGGREPFAVAVCDVNGLKQINDTQGHKAGDEHIRRACSLICRVFKRSPVYRIGGDEFTVILQGADYKDREALFASFHGEVAENLGNGGVVTALGQSVYQPGTDDSFQRVFERADTAMYKRKKALKQTGRE